MRRFTILTSSMVLLVGCSGVVETSPSGAGGSTGTTTTTSTTTTSTSTSGAASSSSSSSSGGAGCNGATCGPPFQCCGGACVNPQNDILNCGVCGNACGGMPYCDHGVCGAPPCSSPAGCGAGGTCCGAACCKPGEICCDVPGPVEAGPKCQVPDPMTMTCDKGCPACVCAAPDTPIATPEGDRPIAALRPGDLVFSVDGEAVVAVPVARVNRAPVHDHHVVRVALANGAVLEVSPRHPTADGRTFGDLRAGGALDGVAILAADLVPYAHPFTYDILPASSTGAYYAGGALIGTTLPR